MHGSLLQYIVAYREHQEFHEQCLERMFTDISMRCDVDFLHIQAFYTRRGGLEYQPVSQHGWQCSATPLDSTDSNLVNRWI